MIAVLGAPASVSPLEAKLQAFATAQAQKTGFAIQMAYHSSLGSFSVAAGNSKGRPMNTEDRFLFGSGTKPYTASSVMQLADAGTVSLESPAANTIDKGLRKLGSEATFASLFGATASKVTVGMLLRMQSGINDFDVPSFDNPLLTNGSAVHSPLEFIRAAANLNPVFVCMPGNCTSYSSTNYVLAGLVLLGARAEPTWQALDQAAVFPSPSLFPSSVFLSSGAISSKATVAGQVHS